MSTTAPPPGCSTCQVILLERFRQAIVKAELDAHPAQATHLPHPGDLAADRTKLWDNGKVFQVWFINGKKHQKHVAIVKEVVKEWEMYANVSFTFPSEWNEESPPEVRILFAEDGNWSYIGRDILKVIDAVDEDDDTPDRQKKTMNLKPADTSREGAEAKFRGTILHEFGHTLGFMHEHQRPDAEFKFKYNTQKLYEWYERKYGWGLPKVYEQVFNFEENEGRVFAANALDTKSIMMYSVPAEILEAGSPAIPPNYVLSDGDKKWVARLYPQKGERQPWKPEEIIYG